MVCSNVEPFEANLMSFFNPGETDMKTTLIFFFANSFALSLLYGKCSSFRELLFTIWMIIHI